MAQAQVLIEDEQVKITAPDCNFPEIIRTSFEPNIGLRTCTYDVICPSCGEAKLVTRSQKIFYTDWIMTALHLVIVLCNNYLLQNLC